MRHFELTRRTFMQASAAYHRRGSGRTETAPGNGTELGGKDLIPVTAPNARRSPLPATSATSRTAPLRSWRTAASSSWKATPSTSPRAAGCAPRATRACGTRYDPDRILYPLKRVGARGEGKWKRITWDEALTEIAQKLDAAIKEDPNTIC